MQPFFTIIIPTKYRPKLIEVALYSMKQQTFKDFEVIICDDYDTVSCKEAFDKYADERFQYVHPPKELNLDMNGNWEYALQFAKGKYIGYMQDKMFFYKDALEIVYNTINQQNYPDIVNWEWDFYSFENEGENYHGTVNKIKRSNTVTVKNAMDAIDEKIDFNGLSYQTNGTPGWGTILSSVVKSQVINLIKKEHGKVFCFCSPDYGPSITFLYYSKKVVKINDNLTVLMDSITSHGCNCSKEYQKQYDFLANNNNGLKIMKYAVVPMLLASLANMVTAEYNYSLCRIQQLRNKKVKLLNALPGIYFDMKETEYPYDRVQLKEKELFNQILKKLSKEDLIIYKKNIEIVRKNRKNNTISIKRYYYKLMPLKWQTKLRALKHRDNENQFGYFRHPNQAVEWVD